MEVEDSLNIKYQFAECISTQGREPALAIQGKYCSVKGYHLPDQTTFWVPSWQEVGADSETSTEEEFIAYAISSLPHTDWFVNFQTLDQVNHWVVLRDCSIKIAYCFLAEQGQLNNPLLKQLEASQITSFEYEYACVEAKIYSSFWNALRINGEILTKSLKSYKSCYSFTSIHKLFIEVMREDLEGEFCQCLRPRSIYNATQADEIAKLKSKQYKSGLSAREQKKLYSLIDRNVYDFAGLYNDVLKLVQKIAQNDSTTARYLEAYYRHHQDLNKLQIQKNCVPELRVFAQPSYTWDRGIYLEGFLPWNS